MKFKLYIVLIIIGTFIVVSCEKTKTFEDLHKTDNELIFTQTANTPGYKKIESQTNAGFILYKEITAGKGATPVFTDKVKVLYTGWYKKDWKKPDEYKDDKGNVIKNKIIFDSTKNRGNIPSILSVSKALKSYNNGVIDGFSTALQHMKVGDKWEVWIPWELSYNGEIQNDIPTYTTLVFEIELLEIL